MEYPDQLKTPVSPRHPGFGTLDGFLWEVAAWDPEAERVLEDAYGEGTDAELAEAARRLVAERVLTDPATVAMALRLLAQAGALGPDTVEALLGAMVAPGEGPASVTATGPAARPWAGTPIATRGCARSPAAVPVSASSVFTARRE